jgi:hypothetical protein
MARSPSTPRQARRGVSPYEKRIAAYQAKHPGATRAEARGHKPRVGPAGERIGEHITRRERERAAGVTTYQRRATKALAAEQARRIEGSDPDAVEAEFLGILRHDGFDVILAIRAEIRRLARDAGQWTGKGSPRSRAKKRGQVIDLGELMADKLEARERRRAEMEAFAGERGLSDWRLLFYHST